MEIKESKQTLTTLKQRAEKLAAVNGWSVARLQAECGLSNAFFANVSRITPKTAAKIRQAVPKANIDFLNTGKGEPLIDKEETITLSTITVPLLPTTAQGGYLNDFQTQVNEHECERIVSPIKDATLAITVVGDSMSPEYPNGSKILLKRIDESIFIEWGRTHVLDTLNGIILKNIHPCKDDDDYIVCRSVNPNFDEFKIKKSDVRGWYRVLMQMSLK